MNFGPVKLSCFTRVRKLQLYTLFYKPLQHVYSSWFFHFIHKIIILTHDEYIFESIIFYKWQFFNEPHATLIFLRPFIINKNKNTVLVKLVRWLNTLKPYLRMFFKSKLLGPVSKIYYKLVKKCNLFLIKTHLKFFILNQVVFVLLSNISGTGSDIFICIYIRPLTFCLLPKIHIRTSIGILKLIRIKQQSIQNTKPRIFLCETPTMYYFVL